MGDEQRVGYGNPPKGSRFKKGQSGNRRGRPKGSKNLKTDLIEELQTEIKVREGPRAIKISKQRAIVKTLIAKTLTGDARAVTTLTNLMCRVLDLRDEIANSEELLSPDESETLEMFRERLLRSANGVAAEKSHAGTALPPSKERAADLTADCNAETKLIRRGDES
jgi:hypothetical protein